MNMMFWALLEDCSSYCPRFECYQFWIRHCLQFDEDDDYGLQFEVVCKLIPWSPGAFLAVKTAIPIAQSKKLKTKRIASFLSHLTGGSYSLLYTHIRMCGQNFRKLCSRGLQDTCVCVWSKDIGGFCTLCDYTLNLFNFEFLHLSFWLHNFLYWRIELRIWKNKLGTNTWFPFFERIVEVEVDMR